PLLNAAPAGAGCEIEQEREIEHERRRENGIAAEKVDFELHRVTEPAEDVDVVPALFGVAAGRIVVDADLVIEVAIEAGVGLRLENVIEHAELARLLGLE